MLIFDIQVINLQYLVQLWKYNTYINKKNTFEENTQNMIL